MSDPKKVTDELNNFSAGIEVTETDKEKYFKCFLSDQPYTETISMFDGSVNVKFKALNVEENEDIIKQISIDKDNGVTLSDDSYFLNLVLYRMVQSIQEINDKPFKPENHKTESVKDGDTYVKENLKYIKSFNSFKLNALILAFKKFEDKINLLTEAIQTRGFWKAVA